MNPSPTPNVIYDAFRRMKAKDFGSAESLLREGLQKAESEQKSTEQALFHSTLGVLAKLKGEYKEAWRCYERAEKLLPDDPSLKLIMAKLLIDQFSQFDQAIRKMKQILKLAKGSASFEHQAHATMAIAFLKKGDRKKAVEMFELSVGRDFEGVSSAENLNFEVIEAFLARSFEVDRCKRYVLKALDLARKHAEDKPIQFLTKLLESFEVTLH
jgi:tetratricopeptide (TPR) repeat protein